MSLVLSRKKNELRLSNTFEEGITRYGDGGNWGDRMIPKVYKRCKVSGTKKADNNNLIIKNHAKEQNHSISRLVALRLAR